MLMWWLRHHLPIHLVQMPRYQAACSSFWASARWSGGSQRSLAKEGIRKLGSSRWGPPGGSSREARGLEVPGWVIGSWASEGAGG